MTVPLNKWGFNSINAAKINNKSETTTIKSKKNVTERYKNLQF